MKEFKVTFKRVEAFYQTINIKANSKEEAREEADRLSSEGEIAFDYFQESDLFDDYILSVEEI